MLGVVLAIALGSIRTQAADELLLVTNPPPFGTFYSITLAQPPLPINPFPDLPVYAIDNGIYVYDDRQVDYVALQAESLSSFSAEGGGGTMSSSIPIPGGGGGGGSGDTWTNPPPPYSAAGLKLSIPVFTNGYVYTTVFDHNPALAYDVYAKTNLNSTNWMFSSWGIVGQTNYYLLQSAFPADFFLMAGNNLDSDGDGMPDNWEAAYGLNPHSAADASQDADGDGLTNLQELLQGTNPTGTATFQALITSPRGVLP